MNRPEPRRSYTQILALIGVLFAFSGFSEILISLDAEWFEITVTPEQAVDLDYDVDVDDDDLDEKQKDFIEDLLDDEIDEVIPGWLSMMVWVPYLFFGALGVMALGGFYKWGRLLGVLSLLGALLMLGATVATDVVLTAALETVGENAMPGDLDARVRVETGPALGRFQTGSLMILVASLVAIIRPDRR